MKVLPSVKDASLAALFLRGQVGIVPTDTIYGLVALAADEAAVNRLYGLKHREHKPGTIIAASPAQLIRLGLDEAAVNAVSHLWPNPLSIVLPVTADLEYLHQGMDSLAVRIPANKALQALLEQTGPLLTSSANHPGQAPAHNLADAQSYFGDSVDFYVEGGDLSGRPPSTVVAYAGGHFEVLREGALPVDELRRAV